MDISFYDGEGKQLSGDFARVDASSVLVDAGPKGMAWFDWSEGENAWVWSMSLMTSEAAAWEGPRWESWQDAAMDVLGVDCSKENPI